MKQKHQHDVGAAAEEKTVPLWIRILGGIWLVIRRALLFVLTFAVLTAGGLFAAATMIYKGPSPAARNVLVMTCLETSALKFLPRMYFDEEEITEIITENTVRATEEITDTDLIEIPTVENSPEFDINAVELIDITGPSYKGKMLIVNDPSRVFVGTSDTFGTGLYGKKLTELTESYDALAGVNGGGFLDEGGVGKGGQPIGIVISQGELKYGTPDGWYELIGFDNDNKFVIGQMSGQQAIDRGIRDAVSFGPFLIINGEPASFYGGGGGLNPRTAIGQRADGAVLLLVIDGRQPNSLGANYSDLISIMMEYGAVNAANLDGGSSAEMIYDGAPATKCCSFYGARYLPTCVLVKKR